MNGVLRQATYRFHVSCSRVGLVQASFVELTLAYEVFQEPLLARAMCLMPVPPWL